MNLRAGFLLIFLLSPAVWAAEPGRLLVEAHGLLKSDAASAESLLKQVVGTDDSEARVMALDLLGALYERQGRAAEALSVTRRALNSSQNLDIPDYAYRLDWRLARLLEASDSDAALDAWREAVRQVQRLRAGGGNIPEDSLQLLFSGLTDRLLRGAEGDQALYREALAVWESYKVAELQDHLGESCIIARSSLDEERVGDASVAVLYPILLPDRLELILGVGGEMHRHTNHRDRQRMESVARKFVTAVGKHRRGYRRYGKWLYRLLIGPFEQRLKQAGVHTLVVVPDGVLRSVPVAALQAGDGRFLVQNMAPAVTPGLSLVQSSGEAGRIGDVLLAGLNQEGEYGGARFAPLPGAGEELGKLAVRFGATPLINGAFTSASLTQALTKKDYDLIHLASHAEIGARRENSFLLTGDGALKLDELERQIARRRFAGRALELLTLSACRTAVGNAKAALGLGGLAVQTGARSALASLWQVNDTASSRLMELFYQYWAEHPEQGKAAALQAAQQQLIDEGLSHPFYWAGFQLIGSWR